MYSAAIGFFNSAIASMGGSVIDFLKEVALELIKNPGIFWVLLAGYIFLRFYKPIRDDVLPNLSGFKVMGVEFSFVKSYIGKTFDAVEAAKNPQWDKVIIPKKDRQRVLNRVKKHLRLFREARLLWIDDIPESLRGERKMLRSLLVDIDIAKSTSEAEQFLQTNEYDLILSDIARGDDRQAGLKFLEAYSKREKRVPVIFYIGYLQPEKGVPGYAFGITHRPDELLHLIMDALERVRS